jgi:hypothetical protein
VVLEPLYEGGVDVYEVVYAGEIDPFRLRRLNPVVLSSKGEESMREFLR